MASASRFASAGDGGPCSSSAPIDSPVPGSEAFLKTANARHLEALVEIAGQLRETGDVADGLSDADVANIIFFHFRYEQFELAASAFGWGEPRARDWIRGRVEAAVLRP